MSENAKALSGIYRFISLQDKPKLKKSVNTLGGKQYENHG